MRKRNEFGIAESAEFIEELDDLCLALEGRLFQSKIDRKEQVVIDVYETIGGVEGNGLHQFWGYAAPDRILESFRLLGAKGVADAIEQCRWAANVIAKGTDAEGHYQFTKEQESQIDGLEEQVYEMFIRTSYLTARIRQTQLDQRLTIWLKELIPCHDVDSIPIEAWD